MALQLHTPPAPGHTHLGSEAQRTWPGLGFKEAGESVSLRAGVTRSELPVSHSRNSRCSQKSPLAEATQSATGRGGAAAVLPPEVKPRVVPENTATILTCNPLACVYHSTDLYRDKSLPSRGPGGL